jgi:hypothetical protein
LLVLTVSNTSMILAAEERLNNSEVTGLRVSIAVLISSVALLGPTQK